VIAARLWADALGAQPQSAIEPGSEFRFNAACAAIQAGFGQGVDAPAHDDDRARFRSQAHDWLWTDLKIMAARLDAGGKTVPHQIRQRLARWKRGAELAQVREPGELDKLSSEEADAWRRFWTEVGALLVKAGGSRS